MKTQEANSREEIILYQTEDGSVDLSVRIEEETLWLNLNQMSELFQRDKSVLFRHLRNVYQEGELDRKATVAKNATVQIEGNRTVTRQVEFYNLDAIISVGYRVNSKRGTQFRIWATKVLRDHIIKGYTVNERRLRELEQAVRLVAGVVKRRDLSGDEARSLLQVVSEYTQALDLLDDDDHKRVEAPEATSNVTYVMSYEEAHQIVSRLRGRFGESAVFGIEKDKSLASALGAVMQTFDGKDLYPSLEEKVPYLLYFCG